MSDSTNTTRPTIGLRLRARLLWYNLVRRHVVRWFVSPRLQRLWVAEGRDPAMFSAKPGRITTDHVRWALRLKGAADE